MTNLSNWFLSEVQVLANLLYSCNLLKINSLKTISPRLELTSGNSFNYQDSKPFSIKVDPSSSKSGILPDSKDSEPSLQLIIKVLTVSSWSTIWLNLLLFKIFKTSGFLKLITTVIKISKSFFLEIKVTVIVKSVHKYFFIQT